MIRRLFDMVTAISLLLCVLALVSYDLRASTDRCPECGTMIPHPPAPDIAEDLLPCPRCATLTWHVIRTYPGGTQRIECEACKLVTVDCS